MEKQIKPKTDIFIVNSEKTGMFLLFNCLSITRGLC